MAASVADSAAVNPNGIKALLANDISTFSVNSKPTLINEIRKLLMNTPF